MRTESATCNKCHARYIDWELCNPCRNCGAMHPSLPLPHRDVMSYKPDIVDKIQDWIKEKGYLCGHRTGKLLLESVNEITSLRAQLNELAKALRFYADGSNYHGNLIPGGRGAYSDPEISNDNYGGRARAVLAVLEKVEAVTFNPNTSTILEIRDWIAKQDGWKRNPLGGWDGPGNSSQYKLEHPIEESIEEAMKLPPGWWYTIYTDHNPGVTVKALKAPSDPVIEIETYGETEIEARFRLRALCIMAEQEKI